MGDRFYFSDDRCKYSKGQIQVQTEFPYYEPGNLVNGKIFIEVFQPLACTDVEIECKGAEKVSFKRFYYVTEDDHQVEKCEKVKKEHKFAEYKQRVYQVPGGYLQPGTYAISFQFQLQDGLPSSVNFKDKKRREEPKAKVKYYVKTVVHTVDPHDKMKYKQVLAIRQKPVDFKMNEGQHEKSKVTTWCCIDQGTSTMWANFEQNVYTPEQTAKAMINCDNSKCRLAVKQVQFRAEQKIHLKAGHHAFNITNKLVESKMDGPQAE